MMLAAIAVVDLFGVGEPSDEIVQFFVRDQPLRGSGNAGSALSGMKLTPHRRSKRAPLTAVQPDFTVEQIFGQ